MRRSVRAGAVMLAMCAGSVVLPAQSLAATASIAPSQLTAGKTVDVTVSAAQCSAYDVILSGAVLVGPANLIDSGRKAAMAPTHQFQGQVEVATNAANGSHSLSVRCGGGNYGSVHVTVSHGQSSGGSGGSGGGSGGFTLQLGRTYAHSHGAADGDVVGQKFGIATSACHSSIAKRVVFPKHAGIYNADGVGYDSGAEFNKIGPIFSDSHGVYVSPVLHPGSVAEHLACENQFGTVLSHFTLHIKLARKVLTNYRSKLSPAGVFQALNPGFNGIDAGGLGSDVFVSVPACRDPKALLTLSSPGLAPTTITSPNHHIGVTDFEGWETKFAFRTVTAVATAGNYPETISCGSGKIATGTLRVG
jgi:hypothetical protein